MVEYAGKEVPKSPFHIQVETDVDVSKVEIKGLETRKFVDVMNILYGLHFGNLLKKGNIVWLNYLCIINVFIFIGSCKFLSCFLRQEQTLMKYSQFCSGMFFKANYCVLILILLMFYFKTPMIEFYALTGS